MIGPLTPLPPGLSTFIRLFYATLTLAPLKNLWLKSRSDGVVLTENYGLAVIVQFYFDGVVIFIPDKSYREMKKRSPYLGTYEDVEFSFTDPYSLQVPKPSKQVELMQLLVPIARPKRELYWSLQELKNKRSELIDLLADLTNYDDKDKVLYYEEKLHKMTLVIEQVNELMDNLDRYIDRIEVGVKIVDDFPDISIYWAGRESLIQRSMLIQQVIKKFKDTNIINN